MDYISYFKQMNQPFLEGQVAVVTGSSKGIGRETALCLASLGADVVVCYFGNQEKAQEVCARIEQMGRRSMCFGGDLSDFEVAKRLIDQTIEKFSKIDILVNNAGITGPMFFTKIDEAEWDKMAAMNFKNMYNCCYHAVPHMMEKNYGRIINTSSLVGKSGSIGAGAHYCAAKAGAIGFSKALANQLAPYHITVNTVAPGMIETDMIMWRTPEMMKEHVKLIPLQCTGKIKESAEPIAFLASRFADYITGYCMDINGGLYMD